MKEAVAAAKGVLVGDVVQKDMGFVPPAHYIVTTHRANRRARTRRRRVEDSRESPRRHDELTDLRLAHDEPQQLRQHDRQQRADDRRWWPRDQRLWSRQWNAGNSWGFHAAIPLRSGSRLFQECLAGRNAKAGVLQAFHILNQFDIPKGSARGIEHGREVADYTLWTSAADLKNLRYYYRTFENSRIRMVDLKSVDFDAAEIRTILMQGDEQIEDVSSTAK